MTNQLWKLQRRLHFLVGCCARLLFSCCSEAWQLTSPESPPLPLPSSLSLPAAPAGLGLALQSSHQHIQCECVDATAAHTVPVSSRNKTKQTHTLTRTGLLWPDMWWAHSFICSSCITPVTKRVLLLSLWNNMEEQSNKVSSSSNNNPHPKCGTKWDTSVSLH